MSLPRSIHGGDEERERRRLERDLRRTHLHQTHSDHSDSLEYPRHAPQQLSFLSISHRSRSRDYLRNPDDGTGPYQTDGDDDDEGIPVWTGDTISTTNHHASALTLNAGLAGRGHRRDLRDLSATEYDPERHVNNIVANATGKISVLEPDVSKSNQYRVGASGSPLIVEDTAELDDVLQREQPRPFTMNQLRSPNASLRGSPSHKSSNNQRPRLSDALDHLTFSPKRPRNTQPILLSPSPYQSDHHRNLPNESDMATPRPAKPHRAGPQATASHASDPSNAGSNFTRLARGIGRDLEKSIHHAKAKATQRSIAPNDATPADVRRIVSRSTRSPFGNIENTLSGAFAEPVPTPRDSRSYARDRAQRKIQLPDVTGLTSAVGTPQKASNHYQEYEAEEHGQVESRLITALNGLQSKLLQLEVENGTSRRRVHELELELDRCKKEVVRERTRVLEREDIIVQQQQATPGRKNISRSTSIDPMDDPRYRQALEEKKALEELVDTLRSHLARLTAELSTQKKLLDDLRAVRELDARTLKDKCLDVELLRAEVDRLSGEVDVLRGVVEEGLQQRQANRDHNGPVCLAEPEETENYEDEPSPEPQTGRRHHVTRQGIPTKPAPWPESESGDSGSPMSSPSQSIIANRRGREYDRTMPTDHATVGTSAVHGATRFLDEDELQRINNELQERRTELSASRSHNTSLTSSTSSVASEAMPPTPPPEPAAPMYSIPIKLPREQLTRPTAPTPARAIVDAPKHHREVPDDIPFPRIHGERLERLFFSTTDHDAKTCSVCHRRRLRAPHGRENRRSPEREDEGFAEGPEPLPKGTEANDGLPDQSEDRLPPQTVLARVVRELEDDFVHFKSIYIELADQYKFMDPASNVAKRNVLAEHLREVIDTLEQKGDQIASLYDLLKFGDKPVSESVVPDRQQSHRNHSAPAVSTHATETRPAGGKLSALRRMATRA